MGGTPTYYPTLSDRADPTKEIRGVTDYLRKLTHELQVQVGRFPLIFLTRKDADALYSARVLRRNFQTGGSSFLNVTDLPGVLAQPQPAGAKTGSSTPSLLSPLSQNGTFFIITPANTLQFFDGSSSPGTWKAVSAAPSSGYTTIQQDGVPLTQRSILNILSTGGLLATDDGGGTRTQLTVGTIPVANGGTGGTSLTDGTNIKNKRVGTGSIAASTTADVTVTWTTPFSDTNYTVQVSMQGSAVASTNDLRVHHWRYQATPANGIIVTVVNDDAGSAHSGTVHASAWHD